jgi:hypothetical protein
VNTAVNTMDAMYTIDDDDDVFECILNEALVLNTQHLENDEEPSFDYGQKIISSIEAEYKGLPDVSIDRVKEKAALSLKLKEKQNKLRNTKNIKNHKKVVQNAQISDIRKKLRAEIEEIKDQIYNIDLEEKGSNITSTNLVDASIKSSNKK